jgi:hypothetical protein
MNLFYIHWNEEEVNYLISEKKPETVFGVFILLSA